MRYMVGEYPLGGVYNNFDFLIYWARLGGLVVGLMLTAWACVAIARGLGRSLRRWKLRREISKLPQWKQGQERRKARRLGLL